MYNNIVDSDRGLFHGVSINDSFSDVKTAEKNSVLTLENDYTLEFKQVLSNGSLKTHYAFDEIGLYKIEVLVSSDSPEKTKEIENKLSAFYSSEFGTGTITQDYETWLFADEKIILELRKLQNKKEIIITFEALE
ncbi:MAG: hypothetical protein U9N85_09890 [Bacteroidota bacterium]|nr:hypothetical protein [Bacteroidota bacterium]